MAKETPRGRSSTKDVVMQEDFKPPVPAATMHTCQSGPNEGKRYWALRAVDDRGNYQSTFLKWVDKPAMNATQKIDQLEKIINKLIEINKLKKPNESDSEDE